MRRVPLSLYRPPASSLRRYPVAAGTAARRCRSAAAPPAQANERQGGYVGAAVDGDRERVEAAISAPLASTIRTVAVWSRQRPEYRPRPRG